MIAPSALVQVNRDLGELSKVSDSEPEYLNLTEHIGCDPSVYMATYWTSDVPATAAATVHGDVSPGSFLHESRYAQQLSVISFVRAQTDAVCGFYVDSNKLMNFIPE